MTIVDELTALEEQALAALRQAGDTAALGEWKSQYLGRQLKQAGKSLATLPADERPAVGRRLNELRAALEGAYAAAADTIARQELQRALVDEQIDVSLPGRKPSLGHIHPSNQTLREIFAIFGEMGFQVWESPEVETDDYNFGLLNFLPDHPARDMQDTFYVETPPDGPKVVLRTHTSPGQIHAMRRYAPNPVRVLLPGKCYRNEQVTARSEFMFHQFEFLAVGHDISLANLKGTLDTFARKMYGEGARTRLRPSYFPFTEPSAEMDVSCFLCGGKGCRVCKYSGWLEIGGCGMVHPNVLRNGGYDPAVFSGFAGGFGPERITMLKYAIEDIRWFFSGDTRFLEQFG